MGSFALGFAAGCGPQPLLAQDAPKPEPKLSKTETVAIGAVAEKLAQNRRDLAGLMETLHELEAEIVAEHPGYHFDEVSGAIVKDPPPAKPGKK